MTPAPRNGQDFAIYVHWPFCVSKCPYCDFNSHVREGIDQQAWRQAFLAELDYWAARTGPQTVSAIFFGGGTPSTMPPETTAAIIDRIRHHWPIANSIEITLEANPSSVEAGRFAAFAGAGVNRFSLGVQSFDNDVLKFLGRAHDSREAVAAIETACSTVDRVSFDLIYALPDQTADRWQAELSRALAFDTGHLSLYQLTIEPNTGFAGQVARGVFTPMPEDPSADLYDLTQQVTSDAGLPAYETSNHARPGEESRHNLAYWQYGAWIGVGPGAHGRPVLPDGTRLATDTLKKPERWLDAVVCQGHGAIQQDLLSADEQATEALVMGLRLSGGIQAARFQAATGRALDQTIDTDAAKMLTENGLLDWNRDTLRVTEEGRLVLNSILAELSIS